MARGSAVAPRYEWLLRPSRLHRLARFFRAMNRGMVLIWRLGLGRWADAWPSSAGRVLVVEHRGRRSGNRYRTPLNFTPEGARRFCLAGFGAGSDWYRNVMAADQVVLWLPDGRWTAHAADGTDAPGSRERFRRVLIDSGFAARLIGLDPAHMSDTQIDEAVAGYRLVEFTLVDRCDTGAGDLAWVWAPVTVAGAAVVGCGVARWRCRGGATARG